MTIEQTTARATTKSFLIAEWIAKSFDLNKYVLMETLSQFKPEDLVYPPRNTQAQQHHTNTIIERVDRLPNMVFLGMLNSECIVTHTSIGINLGFDGFASNREYCTLALQEPINALKVSNNFVSVDGTMNVTISLPMISQQHELQGFALAGLDLEFFQRWLELLDQDQDHNVIGLYDLNSVQIARKPLIKAQIGKKVVEEKLNTMAATANPEPFEHRILSPVDGIDRVWSLRKIEDLPFIVVVGEQTQEALKAWRHQLYFYLVAGFLLSMSIVISTMAYVRNFFQADKMRQLATIDPLTGLANRRHLTEQAAGILARAQRSEQPVVLIMADLDYFKLINDQLGHEMGDRVLCEVAQLLKMLSRQGDLIARWGGEEFLILLPDTDIEKALIVAERIRCAVEALKIDSNLTLSISLGITLFKQSESFDINLNRADAALYQAKHRGRNRIEMI